MGKKEKGSSETDLGDVVLSWTIDDIQNHEIYKDQVKKIPERFQSIEYYLEAYAAPLIEETRMDLCYSLENVSEAPCGCVVSMKEAVSTLKEEYKPHTYIIDVGYHNNAKRDGRGKYKARNGDVFILSSMKPAEAEDLDRYGVIYIIALVTKVLVDDEFEKRLKIRVSDPIDLTNDTSSCNYVIFLTNILTPIRIWRTLSQTGAMNSNMALIKAVISPDSLAGATCDSCLSLQHDGDLSTSLTDALVHTGLNDSQYDAVRAAVHLVQCEHLHSMELIWGPPGTGKTITLCSILWAFMHTEYRILACAPTNAAVVRVCLQLLQFVKQLPGNGTLTSLGDIVLLGNEDSLQVKGDLEDVFLDNRIDQLFDCFAPTLGWKHRMAAMINFLENCISEYDLLLKNSIPGISNGLFEYVKATFDILALQLGSCIRKMWLHIPTSSVSNENSKDMSALLEALDTFGSILSTGTFSEEELKIIFSYDSSLEDCHSVSSLLLPALAKSLLDKRLRCLGLLGSLHGALNLPHDVQKYSIKNFCLQNAKVIICTASSSTMLHHVKMKPLDVLLIDEAAQLKECESIIPLSLRSLKHAILVGDEMQLHSLVKSQVSKEAGFGMSLFERLQSLGCHGHFLNTQYRMHPSINYFPNVHFYRNKILNGLNVQDSSYGRNCPDFRFGNYAFLHIDDGKEEAGDDGNSLINMVEVAIILQLVRSICKSMEGSGQSLSIGILSPYRAQVNQIEEKLRDKFDMQRGISVRVSSIDGFQGEEDDVIILSTVRSNRNGVVGFVGDPNRANVSLTRARHCLWILGNAATLTSGSQIWEALVRDAKNRNCFVIARDHKDLVKAIIQAKQDLNQHDDLFNSDTTFLINARWKIIFSEDFGKSFAKTSRDIRNAVIQRLQNLAEGHRYKTKNHTDSFNLAKVHRVRNLYLVWTVDVEKHENYVQVIKVWDLSSEEQITRLLKRLENIFAMYTDVYIKHCREICTEGKLEVPMSWKGGHDIIHYKKLCRVESTEPTPLKELEDQGVLENSKVSESLLLMKFYSLSSGVMNHLLTASDGTELDIPYELTFQEKEVMLFPGSSFILGRSGTGKTTVLTMKLIQREQQHCIASKGIVCNEESYKSASTSVLRIIDSNEKGILRQVFITVSPKLCSVISGHIYRLKSFVTGGDYAAAKSTDMLDISDFSDIPDCLIDLPEKHYPLVITFWKFLMMLDGSIGNSFFEKLYSESGLSVQKISKSHALQAFIRSREVNYQRFVGSYWPHFNTKLTKKLDASTVFTQIISHIKGGLQGSRVPDRKLERDNYVKLSENRGSRLTSEIREMIYDIFTDYESQKQIKREFDLSDFVMDLHSRLTRHGYLGDKVDFLYIDEVQDLTMRQITLFKHVCKNYREGYTFAGDTAQTIARGIDFKFEEIRSLFYTEFLSEIKSGNQEKKQGREVYSKDMFQLNQNFRTHVSVLKLAHSIMTLLYKFFPLRVDKLIPETSLIYGEAPVLLKCGPDENAIITIFGKRESGDYSVTGFGSEQVILVRDDSAKKQVLDVVGNQALVLTIVECKGLEFQDVLLYNFFGESPLKNKWRVIYQHMKELGHEPSVTKSFPSFDEAKHNVLCSELKHLYVAITRTRQRLWICESDDEFCKPMFEYWKSLALVQVRQLDSFFAQAMRVDSSPEEWTLRGIQLFNDRNYDMAAMCFERAGDEYRKNWATAASLCATADLIIDTECKMGETALKKAADIYESIGKSEDAATCYIRLKDFKKAGEIYLEKFGTSRLKDAGECLYLAECWSLAANAYGEAKCFSDCLQSCIKAELFDEGLQFLQRWRNNEYLDERKHQELDELEASYQISCLNRLNELGNDNQTTEFVKAISSLNQHRPTLKLNKPIDELLLEQEGTENCLEAETVSKMKANMIQEAETLEKAGHFRAATKVILLYVVVSSLWAPGSKGWPLKIKTVNDDLLVKAKHLASRIQESDKDFYTSVCSEIYVLSSSTKNLSELADHIAVAYKRPNIRQEVFTLRSILDLHLNSEASKYEMVGELVLDVSRHTAELLSQNKLSTETLMHIWDTLQERMLAVQNHVSFSETPDEGDDFLNCLEEFCFEYFGVRKKGNTDKYIILSSEATWIKDHGLPEHEQNFITRHQFMSCAQNYWEAELQSLSMMVIEKLESLYNFFARTEDTSVRTGKLILHIYKVAKFLSDSNSASTGSLHQMDKYFSTCQKRFYDIVFPLDWQSGISKYMIALLDGETAREILQLCILENLHPENDILTHGQMARMVQCILLRGELSNELLSKINGVLTQMPIWAEFMKELKQFLDLGFGKIPMICRFQEALELFKRDLNGISPHSFLRLIEYLVSFTTSCQGSRGSFVTTRSSLLEMLKCQSSEDFISGCFEFCVQQAQNSINKVLGSVIETIQQLIEDKSDLQSWIRRFDLPSAYYSSFILKSTILLCLASANSCHNMSAVQKLKLPKHIYKDLPKPFSGKPFKALSHEEHDKLGILRIFADTFQKVGDPLVVLCSQDRLSEFSDLDACVINSEQMMCRKDVISILFKKDDF